MLLMSLLCLVAKGDFGKKVAVHATQMDPEITNLKNTINSMIDQLRHFAVELCRIARQNGTEGQLGGYMIVEGLEGDWKELCDTGEHLMLCVRVHRECIELIRLQ